MKPLMKYEDFRASFSYNEFGQVTRIKVMGAKEVGSIASIRIKWLEGKKLDRFYVHCGGKTYRAARIVWSLHNKCDVPHGMVVDHINGNRLDDRPENLRCVTPKMNRENITKAPKTSKSGVLGAYWSKRHNAWISSIKSGCKHIYIGSFKTAEAAHEAYINAKRIHHAGCTI